MAEFNGRSLLTIDAKGRMFLPQGYRDQLGTDFVISLSSDLKTLAFYRNEDWQKKSEKLRRIPETDRRAHKLLRLIFGSTFSSYNADAQGRVLIPQAVRQEYGLSEGSEVTLVGVGSNLEVWNAQRFAGDAVSLTQQEQDETLDYVYEQYFSQNNDLNEGKSEQ